MIRKDNSTSTPCTLFIVDSVPDVDVGGVGDIPAGRVQVDHVRGAAPRVQVACQPCINIFNTSNISVRFYHSPFHLIVNHYIYTQITNSKHNHELIGEVLFEVE